MEALATRFKKPSRQRNFYCHGSYEIDDADNSIVSVQGATLQQDGEPLKFENKKLTKGTLNEMKQKLLGLQELNEDIFDFIDELQALLGVQISDIRRPPRATREALDAHLRQSKRPKQLARRPPSRA